VKVKQHCFLDDKDLSLRLPADSQSLPGKSASDGPVRLGPYLTGIHCRGRLVRGDNCRWWVFSWQCAVCNFFANWRL